MILNIMFRVLLIGLYVWPVLLTSAVKQTDKEGRFSLTLNNGWAFHQGEVVIGNPSASNFDDTNWVGVTIPHVMQVEPKHNGGRVFQGVGWYRRYLLIPKAYKNKRVTLNFEGVQMNCEVFLNGKKIGENFGGYIGFVVDISDHINFGTINTLALKVVSVDDPLTPPGKSMSTMDFSYYGGIYRDVSLLVTENVYITDPLEVDKVAGGGVRISYPKVTDSLALVETNSHVMNDRNKSAKLLIKTVMLNKEGQIVAQESSHAILKRGKDSTFNQQLKVTAPQLWHPDHPYLYSLETEIYEGKRLIDRIETRIGIRSIAFASKDDEADGFYINAKKLYIRGANRHQAYSYVGDAASNSMQYRDALLLKKGGFNAVRAAHYPSSPAFLAACDEVGLLVIECQPSWQYYSPDSIFVERSYRDIQRMIRRDRNHPSIFLWETSLNESPTPAAWMEKAVQVAHAEMPGNQFFVSDDLNPRSRDFYDVFYKVIDRDGNDPFPDKPSLTREWGDAWHADPSKEDGLRASRIYSEKGLLTQTILRQGALNGETSEDKGGYWDHAGLDANKRIAGYFLWSFNDYTRGSDSITAFSGVVDIDRYPKFGFYQMQAMQDARNPTYGPSVFIASYNQIPADSSIVVFSNCDEVRLYRNNHLVGHKTRLENISTAPHIAAKGGSPYFLFETGSYEAGELHAEGILDGVVVSTHSVQTSGEAHSLKVELAVDGIVPIADGSDMVPFYIVVCDKKGNPVNCSSYDDIFIDIDVNGEGMLIGGNDLRVGVNPQHPEGGIAYGLIRTSEKEGEISIQVQSKGLKGHNLRFNTLKNETASLPSGKKDKWISEYNVIKNVKVGKDVESGPHRTPVNLSNVKIALDGEVSAELSALTDGEKSTVWTASHNGSTVITIDMGRIESIDAFRIYWGKDSDWYTHSLETSMDGNDWELTLDTVVASGQDYAIKPIDLKQVRYLKLTLLAVKPESSLMSIREIELFKN